MCPGHPSFYLWKFEVVEVYLLNDEGRYFQLELSPDGRFFAILFREHRDWVSCNHFFFTFFVSLIERHVDRACIPCLLEELKSKSTTLAFQIGKAIR